MMHQRYLVHGKFSAAIATHILLTGSLIYALYRGQKARKEYVRSRGVYVVYRPRVSSLISKTKEHGGLVLHLRRQHRYEFYDVLVPLRTNTDD